MRATGVGCASRRASAVIILALVAAGAPSVADAGSTRSAPNTVTIGALLDLSGDGKSLGRASKAALQVAATDLERQSRGRLDIELDIRDTRQNPQTAVQEFVRLVGTGVRMIVGPQTSNEVRALLEAGANNSPAIIVSNGSTASSLAFPGDSVFRLVPDDRVEGAATASLMDAQDQKTVVVSYRVDPGNETLAASTSAFVRVLGGKAVSGPVYPGGTTSFGPAVRSLAQDVGNEVGGAAVYIAGSDEVADYLAAASDEPELANRTFYGGDGSAKSEAILNDRAAAEMAATSGGFPSPLLTVPADARREARRTIKRIQRKSGEEPDAFSLAAYDALGLAVEALEAAGPEPSAAALRLTFTAAADGYDGVTGEIDLNDAGDRATGAFAFWAVCRAGRSYEWRTIGSWTPSDLAGEPGTVRITRCDAAG
jgi:branched-chain amino acid transport system substrate-binding protein